MPIFAWIFNNLIEKDTLETQTESHLEVLRIISFQN